MNSSNIVIDLKFRKEILMVRKQWSNLRGISIIAVVVIHVTSSMLDESNTLGNYTYILLNQISRFCVPIFLISSGFGLTVNNSYNGSLKEFYKKRFKLLPEYLLWTFFYLVTANFNSLNSLNLIVIVKAILLGNAYYHMYFVVILLYCYLLYPFIMKFVQTKIGICIALMVSLIGELIFQLGVQSGSPYLWNWFFYFTFGIYIASDKKFFEFIIKYSKTIFITGLLFMLGSAFISCAYTNRNVSIFTSSMRPTVILYAIGVLAVGLRYFSVPSKLFEMFDKYSLGIYYVHPLFLTLFSIVEKHVHSNGYSILNFVFVLVFSYLFSKYYLQTKILLKRYVC